MEQENDIIYLKNAKYIRWELYSELLKEFGIMQDALVVHARQVSTHSKELKKTFQKLDDLKQLHTRVDVRKIFSDV